MADTVLLQVRVSSTLLKQIDELCDEGIYRNRSEVISEAIRLLLARYSRRSIESRATAMYLSGKLPKTGNPEERVFKPRMPIRDLGELLGEEGE